MPRFKSESGHGYLSEYGYFVGEDCVVFNDIRCLGHNIKGHAPDLIAVVKKEGKTKAIFIGDCEDHEEWQEEFLSDAMREAGIECAWVDPKSDHIHWICQIMPDFLTMVQRFEDVPRLRQIMETLSPLGQRVCDVRSKIRGEIELLRRFSVIAKVISIESHEHLDLLDRDFHGLFPLPGWIKSEANAIALFNPGLTSGVIVTKSQEIEFRVGSQPVDHAIFFGQGYSSKGGTGSIRICLGKSSKPEISLYTEGGTWKVTPHPEPDVTDLNVHYTPMWQRLYKVEKVRK